MRHLFLALLVFWLGGDVAAARPLPEPAPLSNPMVADTSQDAIEIRTSFNGAQLLVFGARNIPGDLVIVVRGPSAKVTMRRKERIAGMWMHVEQHKYFDLPLFYAIASTRPVEEIASPAAIETLGLGKDGITAASHDQPNILFDEALDHSMSGRRWWQAPFTTITYFGESLFKARLDMPDSLPGGEYTVEVYLFSDGELRAAQTVPVTVYKTGLEAGLVASARNHGLAYGVIAILMALFGGWLAHRLFHRD